MQRLILLAVLWFAAVFAGAAAEVRVIKVLPYLLDAEGRHSLQPSLYERDAYQAHLRKNPNLVRAIRYDVLCRVKRVSGEYRLRLELRTAGSDSPQPKVIEAPMKPGWLGRRWTRFTLGPDQLKQLGEVSAWRAVLLEGDREIAEQKSFLW